MEENQNTETNLDKVQVTQDIGGKFHQNEFVKKAEPDKLQLFKCPNDGHMHFRHAGYVIPMLPFVANSEAKVSATQLPVYICIKCKHAYIIMDDKFHDVSDQVDLEAWEKTEKVAHKQTGVGGQC